MEKFSDNIEKNNEKTWISITGFRTLLLLISLIEKPRDIDELVDIVKSHSITQKSISKDTVRLTINTLKAIGCEIERPKKSNGYKYELKKHPFILNLSKDDVDSLLLIRERISNELSWEKVLNLNTVYEKIFILTENPEHIRLEKDTRPLSGVDINILQELASSKLDGRKVTLSYNSPKFGIEDISIVPQKLTYENSRLYLWCYSYKYKKTSILDVERIKRIKNVSLSKTSINTDSYDVEYEVFGSSAKTFCAEENEKILKKTQTSIRICAEVTNEFCFIQRLLLFGNEFKIISPYFFREKLINKIKLIQKGYRK